MNTLLVLTRADRAESMVRWAARTVGKSDRLTVLCCIEGYPIVPPAPVSTERTVGGAGLLRVAHNGLEATGLVNTELLEMRHPDRITELLVFMKHRSFDLLVLEAAPRQTASDPDTAFVDRLYRFAACAALLLDPGVGAGDRPSRLVVPMSGAMVAPTLRFAADVASTEGTVVPLLVGSEFGADSRAVARKELELRLKDAGMTVTDAFVPDVIVALKAIDGLVRGVRPGDLLLIPASTGQVLAKFRDRQEALGAPESDAVAVAVHRPAQEAVRSGWIGGLVSNFPKLDAPERVRLFDRLQAGARVNADFLVMMGLATAIAAFGLLQNSTAVVIGAMLVAPMMSPLIGAGFALIQGNIRLFRESMKAMTLGIGFGLFLSIVIGYVNPTEDLTTEIMARTAPEARDLVVAFLSGMAAAYAFARPSLAGTLAGVAIAAALVPPLATVGITISRGFWNAALGAAVLHVTNLVAITLGAAAAFRILRVQGVRLGIGPALWARRAILLLVLTAALLSAPLGYMSAEKIIAGQNRPLAYPLSEVLAGALMERITLEEGVEPILAGRSSYLHEQLRIGLLLASDRPVSPDFRRDLRHIVMEFLGEEADIKIYVLKEAGVSDE